MTKQTQSQMKPKMLLKLAFLQLIATISFSLVMLYCFDSYQSLSALYGGLIAAASSGFMAGRMFTTQPGCEPEELLARFYVSVMLKVVFTLAMMAICIIVIKVSFLPFIIAYFVSAAVVNWLFLLLPDDESRGQKA